MRRHCSYIHLMTFVGIILISCSLSISEAFAHSPLTPHNNERLNEATFITDPTKSWAIYGELHEGGEVQYYRFNISKAQRIHIMLFKSTNPDDNEFAPIFALIGPGIISQGNVPNYLELPIEGNALVVIGEKPAKATYEPFSATSFYSLAELNIDAPASSTYYIAVYEPIRGGRYGLAIGDREVYSLDEWILNPIKLISVYQWEGQSLPMILLPIVATLFISLGLMFWWRKWVAQTLFEWAGFLSGILLLGTGAMFLFQIFLTLTQTPLVLEIVVTIILVLVTILLGIAILRIIIKSREKVDIRKRAYLAILGILALFAWAGLLVGPVLAMLASILPAQAVFKPQKQNLRE